MYSHNNMYLLTPLLLLNIAYTIYIICIDESGRLKLDNTSSINRICYHAKICSYTLPLLLGFNILNKANGLVLIITIPIYLYCFHLGINCYSSPKEIKTNFLKRLRTDEEIKNIDLIIQTGSEFFVNGSTISFGMIVFYLIHLIHK